jgi:hypothetical protein
MLWSNRTYWAASAMAAKNLVNLSYMPGDQGGLEIVMQVSDDGSFSIASVSGCGDMNGDGIPDLVVITTSNSSSNQTGHAFVVYGKNDWNQTLNLSTLQGGRDGFEIYGVPGDGMISAVATAGDLNFDRRTDLILGFPNAAGTQGPNVGAAQVLFGTHFPSAAALVSLGEKHSCALLLYESSVRCWGSNFYGQLGRCDVTLWGNTASQMGHSLANIKVGPSQKVASMSAAGVVTCLLFQDGSVACFGDDSFGQMGLGETSSCASQRIGDTRRTVNLGSSVAARSVHAGASHACAVLNGGQGLKCWGANDFGQLGQGDMQKRGSGENEMGDNLPPVSLGDHLVVSVSMGSSHTCALLDNGKVKCFGLNDEGQLGLGDDIFRGDSPDQMGELLPFVDLGPDMVAVAVTSGGYHTCALLSNRRLKCWGDNRCAFMCASSVMLRLLYSIAKYSRVCV